MHVMKVEDWSIAWPILVLTPFIMLLVFRIKRIVLGKPAKLLIAWTLIYEAFLSLGITATRFFLPLLPVLYILFFLLLQNLLKRVKIPL